MTVAAKPTSIDRHVALRRLFHHSQLPHSARNLRLASLRPFMTGLTTIDPSLGRSLSTDSQSDRFVKIVEVAGRDGLQNIKADIVSVDIKRELVEKMKKAGLKYIEVGSFVSPKAVPQMANTTLLLSKLSSIPKDGSFSVLIPNMKGLSNLLSLETKDKVNEIAVFVSATEGFSQANNRDSVENVLSSYPSIVTKAISQGYRVRGYVSCVITDPYASEPTKPEQVVPVVKRLLNMGCYEVSLGDTTGQGDPQSWGRLWKALMEEGIPTSQLAAHCHDTFATALTSIFSLLPQGLRTIDSSLAGLGGCPYSPGATGNVPTEDVVHLLHSLGYETGIDLQKLMEAGEWLSKTLKIRNESRVGRALYARKQVKERVVKQMSS